jgi:ABC-2 type transport system permease protein
MNFPVVFRKEMLEQWRTRRLLVVAAVFTIFGMASPLLARFTPELMKSIPDMPPELLAAIPAPTMADAVAQYVKNMSQFGILLAILMSMGVVVQEKERGTAVMMLTHPVPRFTFLLAKFCALALVFCLSLCLAGLGCWYYTLLLFEALPWGAFAALNGMMLVVFLVYAALTLLCSTLARTQGASAGLAFAGLLLVAGVGSLPRLGKFFPGQLFNWGTSLALGVNDPAWAALWISLGSIALCLAGAWLVFRRQEL